MTDRPARVVVGVGNTFRRDDGVGPALVAALERLRLPGVRLAVCDGDPADLLAAWAGADLAVVVDAAVCDPRAPGRIHRTRLDRPDDAALGATVGGSTHGLGVRDAYRLAVALGQAPARLAVLAVEADSVSFGPDLSPAVAGAVPALIEAVLAELTAD